MAKTEETLAKIPESSKSNLRMYSSFYSQAREMNSERLEEEYMHKIRGYITCLRDLGIFDYTDVGNIILWVASGHEIA